MTARRALRHSVRNVRSAFRWVFYAKREHRYGFSYDFRSGWMVLITIVGPSALLAAGVLSVLYFSAGWSDDYVHPENGCVTRQHLYSDHLGRTRHETDTLLCPSTRRTP